MTLLILAGIVYAVYTDSIAVAILAGSMIIYRSRRPGVLGQRLREVWYQRAAAQVGEDGEGVTRLRRE